MKKRMNRHWNRILGVLALCVAICLPAADVSAAEIASADSAIISVESYELEEGALIAGEQVTIKLTLQNSSTVTDARNVMMTMDSASYALMPAYGEGNQIYVGDIAADSSVTVTVSATVNSQYDADAAQLECNFNYISGSTSLSNSTTIIIPTYISGSLVPETTVVAGSATVGVNSLVSVKYRNSGSADITDAQLIITGSINEEGSVIDLPTASAGKTYTEDYYVTYTESGIQTVALQYQYTDAQGNTHVTDCGEYTVNVTADVSAQTGSETVSNGSSIVQLLGCGICALIVIVAVLGYWKKRK